MKKSQINNNIEELLIDNMKVFIKGVYNKKISLLNVLIGMGSYLVYKFLLLL